VTVLLVVVRFCCIKSVFLFFFFSSRRRHTSFSRDWSSDVCSSDLSLRTGRDEIRRQCIARNVSGTDAPQVRRRIPLRFYSLDERSEERRVGIECMLWWELAVSKAKYCYGCKEL